MPAVLPAVHCATVRRPLFISVIAVSGLLAAGCGGSSSEEADSAADAAPMSGKVTTNASFPAVEGKRLSEIRANMQGGIVLAPSVSVAQIGHNRYGFALFDTARKQIAGAQAAVYVSKPDGSAVRGPFIARSESLAVKPQYRSKTTQQDPDAAKSVYVADVDLPASGKFRVSAIVDLDGRLVSTSSFGVAVSRRPKGQPPAVGSMAPRIHTPTLADVAGDAARISTRNPPARELLKTDLADVYGKKPVLLLFATPALCASRVCGPVVDVLEQLRDEYGKGDVAFIHNEIYRENSVDQGLRPEPVAFRVPTEPWLFAMDRTGKVVDRIEGAFSVAEARRALEKAKAGGI